MTLHGFSGGLPRKAALLRHEEIIVDGEEAKSRVHLMFAAKVPMIGTEDNNGIFT